MGRGKRTEETVAWKKANSDENKKFLGKGEIRETREEQSCSSQVVEASLPSYGGGGEQEKNGLKGLSS